MRITRAVVPSLFTTLNMFCGFLSMTYSMKNDVLNAVIFILLGALFDSLDGVMARLTKSSSKFGVEFDSLSDVVTFGVAPSFLLYQYQFSSWGSFGVLISSLPMICGGIRLARFNVQLSGFEKEYFTGLPIPAQAAIVCSFLATDFESLFPMLTISKSEFLTPLVLFVSLAMISTIRYDTLPKFTPRDIKLHPAKFTIVTFATLIIIFTKGNALFPVFVLYLLSGIIRWLVTFFKHLRTSALEEEEDDEETEAEFSRVDI
jgi:CDP-diacylglycerol--serine O-phosphatidyltransferase